jgi:hypothetical protein
MRFLLVVAVLAFIATSADAQEARRRWEMQRQIRLDKFEQVLPHVMRTHGIDMWIVAVKENHRDPLWEDLGRGYVSAVGFYVFTDRGAGRVERAALGPSGYLIEESGAYDIFAPASQLAEFVRTRDPRRIGVNMSDEIGPADGLSYTMHRQLVKTLGEPYASRIVSAEQHTGGVRQGARRQGGAEGGNQAGRHGRCCDEQHGCGAAIGGLRRHRVQQATSRRKD